MDMNEQTANIMLFKTVAEKAEEWNISSRHLQHLCKKGVIDGAVKKAGVWFIPDNAALPDRQAKADGGNDFIGTKKNIFDCAIELFDTSGYDAVSIKDIADAVGITQSSIYNHFASKQEILDAIYDFYCRCYLEDRPTMEDIEPILRNGSLMDILDCVTYAFNENHMLQMTGATSILFHRCAVDERAREIMGSLMLAGAIQFVEDVLNRAVEIGRLAPMNTHALAIIINSLSILSFHIWVLDSSSEVSERVRESKLEIYQYISGLISDLTPPGVNA